MRTFIMARGGNNVLAPTWNPNPSCGRYRVDVNMIIAGLVDQERGKKGEEDRERKGEWGEERWERDWKRRRQRGGDSREIVMEESGKATQLLNKWAGMTCRTISVVIWSGLIDGVFMFLRIKI